MPSKSTAPQPQLTLATPAAKRMTLGALVKGRIAQPLRVLLYGVEGIGKSTFASNAPKPVFLGAEDGTSQLDVTRFPRPESFTDVLDAIRELETAEHDFSTLAIDTVDWMEPLVWAHICARDNKANIEAYGFGKGYNIAVDEWRLFLGALERMQRARRMHVVLLAHSCIKTFKNPEGNDYDRYQMMVHDKAGGLLRQWCDAVLFANYETFAAKEDKHVRAKGVDTGLRLMHSERRASFEAKNRFELPLTMPLSWSEFSKGVDLFFQHGPVAELEAKVLAKIDQLVTDTLKRDGLDAIQRAGGDKSKLAQLDNWATAKLEAQRG